MGNAKTEQRRPPRFELTAGILCLDFVNTLDDRPSDEPKELLAHYAEEHDTAIEHLDFAIAELRDMKMQPALERALRHRGLLKA